MKSKFDRYMKDTVKFSILIILYYLFLYSISRIMISMIVGSFDIDIEYEIGCHGFAFAFLILSFVANENNGNSNNDTV